MSVYKCKMCGGTLEVHENESVGTCEYCGMRQTIPTSQDEALQGLFNRATILRLKSEFDKAESLYEKIIQAKPDEAEAYWGLILCRYGIEYVEDPKTFKRVPTCHRTSFDSVIADEDYKAALQYADAAQRELYQAEAKEIDRLQKEILALSQEEEPYDVFICYKETDDSGKRTPDSVIANDIYHQLTQEGFKVFYAAISLENKLGSTYEPCIFAALNSAKVMLVVGTKPEFFNAVWVKNEWSRYLKLMQTDRSRILIPCYKDMDAYELPEEFAHLQAQDMGKIGFINDIVRGVKKITAKPAPQPAFKEMVAEAAPAAGGVNVAALLERAFLFLEDGNWQSADEYCERVLDIDPKNAEAYLGKLMAEQCVRRKEDLAGCRFPFDGSNNYQKVMRFGSEALVSELRGDIDSINARNEHDRQLGIYQKAVSFMNAVKCVMNAAKREENYKAAAEMFGSIPGFRDADALKEKCLENAEICRKEAIRIEEERRKDAIYGAAMALMKKNSISHYEEAIASFKTIPGWKDADTQIQTCQKRIEALKAENARERIAAEKAAKKRKKIVCIAAAIVVVLIAVMILVSKVIVPNSQYKAAMKLYDAGKYDEAIAAFEALDGYKDSEERISECKRSIAYNEAIQLMNDGQYQEAIASFEALNGFKDSEEKISECKNILAESDYNDAVQLMSEGSPFTAYLIFTRLGDYKNSKDLAEKCLSFMNLHQTISSGEFHSVGLKTDGTVVVVGRNNIGQCDVSGWRDIIAISTVGYHTVGLKKDGTVVAVGNNSDGRCDVSGWKDIAAVSAGDFHTVGLKKDGTVVAVGSNSNGSCDVSDWKNIVAISGGYEQTIGLKNDGTVVAVGSNAFGKCDVTGWKDIVAISGGNHTVGLKKDGTVVAIGNNNYGQCDVSEWKDIVAISAGSRHTVGLRKDGTVVAVGQNDFGQCNVSNWKDIVAISAGSNQTIGLKIDGTVVAVGNKTYGRCDVSDWKDIKLP